MTSAPCSDGPIISSPVISWPGMPDMVWLRALIVHPAMVNSPMLKNLIRSTGFPAAFSTILRALGPYSWYRKVSRRPWLAALRSSRTTLTSYPPVSAWNATQFGVTGRPTR